MLFIDIHESNQNVDKSHIRANYSLMEYYVI